MTPALVAAIDVDVVEAHAGPGDHPQARRVRERLGVDPGRAADDHGVGIGERGKQLLRSAPSAYLTSKPDSSWAIPAGESSSATRTMGKDTALPARRRSVWQSDGRTVSRAKCGRSVSLTGEAVEAVSLAKRVSLARGSSAVHSSGQPSRRDQQAQSTEACEILHELIRIRPGLPRHSGRLAALPERERPRCRRTTGQRPAGERDWLGCRKTRLALLPRRRPARHTRITSRT